MSQYNLVVQWSGKDALADNNPDKVVSGDDFNTEFLAVKTAINSKADLTENTQVITAATASAGTNTNQVATTAFVTAALTKATINALVYPIGSIYTTVGSSATTPAEVNTLLGVGTWEAFGEGRVLVGKASSGTFDTLNATGGSETQALTEANLPEHSHSMGTQNQANISIDDRQITFLDPFWSGFGGGSARSTGNTGDGTAHNNLQPYIVVYMWKRTA
jgi:hypothetical protein